MDFRNFGFLVWRISIHLNTCTWIDIHESYTHMCMISTLDRVGQYDIYLINVHTLRDPYLSATYIGPWPYLWEVDQHMSKHTDMLCIYTICLFSAYIFWCILVFSICTNVYPVISCIDMIFWYRYKDIYTTSDVYIHETHTDMFMRPAWNIQGYVHDISTWPSVTILAFQLEMLFIVVTFTSHHEKQVRLSLQHP